MRYAATDDIVAVARRRTRKVMATVLLALAAVVAGLVMTLEHHADGVPTPAPAVASPPRAPTPAGPTGGTASATASGDLSWVTVAGVTVPASASDGPHDTSSGQARGFAHTSLGAVLAAVHITVRLTPQAGPAVFEPTLREQVAGPDAAALGRHLDDDYQAARAQLGLPYGAPAGRLYSTTAGYQVAMSGPDAATVRLLVEGPGQEDGSVLVALVTHMQWTGTDWVLDSPARGDWGTDAAVVTDTTGYTQFPTPPADGS